MGFKASWQNICSLWISIASCFHCNIASTTSCLINAYWLSLLICYSKLLCLWMTQTWMLRIPWRKQEADGFAPMRFMPYSAITNTLQSMSSHCVCPKVIIYCYYQQLDVCGVHLHFRIGYFSSYLFFCFNFFFSLWFPWFFFDFLALEHFMYYKFANS